MHRSTVNEDVPEPNQLSMSNSDTSNPWHSTIQPVAYPASKEDSLPSDDDRSYASAQNSLATNPPARPQHAPHYVNLNNKMSPPGLATFQYGMPIFKAPQITLADSYRLMLSQMSNGQPSYLGPESLLTDVWGAVQYPRYLCGSPHAVSSLLDGVQSSELYGCDGTTPSNSMLPYVPLLRVIAEDIAVMRTKAAVGASKMNYLVPKDVPLGAKEVWLDISRRPLAELWPPDLVPPDPSVGYNEYYSQTPAQPGGVTPNKEQVISSEATVYQMSTQTVDTCLDEMAELVFEYGYRAIHFDFFTMQAEGLILPTKDDELADVPYSITKQNTELITPLNLQISLSTHEGELPAGSAFERGHILHLAGQNEHEPDDMIAEPYVLPNSYASYCQPTSTTSIHDVKSLGESGAEKVDVRRKNSEWSRRGASWQFNLRYNVDSEIYAPNVLKDAQHRGVDFVRHKFEGIPLEYLIQGLCKRGLLGPQPHKFGLRQKQSFLCDSSQDGKGGHTDKNEHRDDADSPERLRASSFDPTSSASYTFRRGRDHHTHTIPLWVASKGTDFTQLIKGIHAMRRTVLNQMISGCATIPRGLADRDPRQRGRSGCTVNTGYGMPLLQTMKNFTTGTISSHLNVDDGHVSNHANCVPCEAFTKADSHLVDVLWDGNHSHISGNWGHLYHWPMEMSLGILPGSVHPGIDRPVKASPPVPVVLRFGADLPVGIINGRVFPTPKMVASVYRRCNSLGVAFPMDLWKATLDFWLTVPVCASPLDGVNWRRTIPFYECVLINNGMAPLRQPRPDYPSYDENSHEIYDISYLAKLERITKTYYDTNMTISHSGERDSSRDPGHWAILSRDENMDYYEMAPAVATERSMMMKTVEHLQLSMLSEYGYVMSSVRNSLISNDGTSALRVWRRPNTPVNVVENTFGQDFAGGGGLHNPMLSRFKGLNRNAPNLGAGFLSEPPRSPFASDRYRPKAPPDYLPASPEAFELCLQYYVGAYLDLRLLYRMTTLLDSGRIDDEHLKETYWDTPSDGSQMLRNIIGIESFLNLSMRSPFLSAPCRYQLPRTMAEKCATEIPSPQFVPVQAMHTNPLQAAPVSDTEAQTFDDPAVPANQKWPLFAREAMQLQTYLPRNEVRHILWSNANADSENGDRDFNVHEYTTIDGEYLVSDPVIKAIPGAGHTATGRCRSHDALVDLAMGRITCADIVRMKIAFCLHTQKCQFCIRTRYGVGQYNEGLGHYTNPSRSLAVYLGDAFVPPAGCPVLRFQSNNSVLSTLLPLTPYPLYPHYITTSADGAFVPSMWKLMRMIVNNAEYLYKNLLDQMVPTRTFVDHCVGAFLGGPYINNTHYKVGPYRGTGNDPASGQQGMWALPPIAYVKFGILSDMIPTSIPSANGAARSVDELSGWLWSDQVLSLDERFELISYLQSRPTSNERGCADDYGFGALPHYLLLSLLRERVESLEPVRRMAHVMAARLEGLGGSLVQSRSFFNALTYKKLVSSLKITSDLGGDVIYALSDPAVKAMRKISKDSRVQTPCSKMSFYYDHLLRGIHLPPDESQGGPESMDPSSFYYEDEHDELQRTSLSGTTQTDSNDGLEFDAHRCLDPDYPRGKRSTILNELVAIMGKTMELMSKPPADMVAADRQVLLDIEAVKKNEQQIATEMSPPTAAKNTPTVPRQRTVGILSGVKLHAMAREFTPSSNVINMYDVKQQQQALKATDNPVPTSADAGESGNKTTTTATPGGALKGRGVLHVGQNQFKMKTLN